MSTLHGSAWFCLGATIFLDSLTLGCSQRIENSKATMPEGLETTKSIKIEYRVKGQWKELTVKDANQVKEILASMSVHHTDETGRGWVLWNKVIFQLPNNEEKKVSIGKKQILDGPHSGLTYLNDTKFYDKINEILTKHEGKKIDVLEDNK